MSSSAQRAHGTLLARNGTTIAEVLGFSGPNLTGQREVTTDLSETWESAIITILRGGDVTLDISYLNNEATHKFVGAGGLGVDFIERTLQTFTITWTNSGGASWTFTAHVSAYNVNVPNAGTVGAQVTLSISGQPVLC